MGSDITERHESKSCFVQAGDGAGGCGAAGGNSAAGAQAVVPGPVG
eukprot:SAG11_NODE_31687_length_289_cov_93.073684_1_plen_45_part_01